MYNSSKLVEQYLAELRRLSKELLVAKKTAKGKLLRSVLQNDGRCWAEFCKYVRRHKGKRESIPAIRDNEGKLVTDTIAKANALNNYYASLFSRESINLQIQATETGISFTTSTNVIRKRISVIGKINRQDRMEFLGKFYN